jgi:hypothetical protein
MSSSTPETPASPSGTGDLVGVEAPTPIEGRRKPPQRPSRNEAALIYSETVTQLSLDPQKIYVQFDTELRHERDRVNQILSKEQPPTHE